MQIADLTVEVRNASFGRVGQLMPADLVGFKAVLRFNNVGSWSLSLPANHLLVDSLRAPGAGIIVTGPAFSFSGPTNEAKRVQTQDDPVGVWEISGLTDDVILNERLAYPTPSTASVTAQTSEYDTRTGKASTIAYDYVSANIGPTAPAARKIANLTLAADTAIGSTITGKARFDSLGKLLTSLCVIDGLGFNLKQSGSNLLFTVYQPVDRSSTIRMDVDNNHLTKTEYTYTAPSLTRAIVAGQGQGTSRTFTEVTTTASTSAESSWGRRIETFIDQRQTNNSTELTQAGTEVLNDKGYTLEAISVSPSDDDTMAYGIDWNLGDKVSVIVGSTTISKIVTEVGILVSEDGVRIGATVGEPATADPESTIADVQSNQEERISNLERNDVPLASGSITNAQLQNNNITINGASVVLGGSTIVSDTPNIVINGNFAINQRAYVSGTALASGTYCFDRWKSGAASTSLTFTSAPQGQTVTLNSGGVIQQIIEQANVIAGTYTLSWFGTATARVYKSGSTAPSYASSPITVSLDGTANVIVEFTAFGGTKTIGLVQLESGSVATTYRMAGGTIQGELAMCQRYYWRMSGNGSSVSSPIFGAAVSDATSTWRVPMILPVKMRAIPTLDASAASTFRIRRAAAGLNATASAVSLTSDTTVDTASIQVSATGAAGDVGWFSGLTNGCYLGFNAEL